VSASADILHVRITGEVGEGRPLAAGPKRVTSSHRLNSYVTTSVVQDLLQATEVATTNHNTLQQTFADVYVIPAVRAWRESPRVTFVIIAGNRPLDLEALKAIDAGDGDAMLASLLLSPAEVEAILTERRPVTLTDRYAPVDQMLAPVFRGEEK